MLGQMEEAAEKPSMYSPLTLAYMGDCVYEVYVRAHLVATGNFSSNKLHRQAMQYVSAKAQSEFMNVLEPFLTDDEEAIYKRGRNAKSATVPKNADLMDYRRATGLEALMGWLYLSGRQERIDEIMTILLKEKRGI
ncbi:MAG: ribonuclease III domain-containing protein [Bacillota bacterium]|nr:ribonuclease III domain-containing protein [Bacillota bacterium]